MPDAVLSTGSPVASQGRQRWALVAALYLAQSVPSYLLIMAVPAALRAWAWAGQDRHAVRADAAADSQIPLGTAGGSHGFGRLGHRRGWVLITQLCTSAGIALLALSDPGHITAVLLAGMLIALSIATQDIATDGFATRLLKPSERPTGNGIQAAAVAVGVIVGGTLSMALFEVWGWTATLLAMAAVSLLPLAVLPWMQEQPGSKGEAQPRASLRRFFSAPAHGAFWAWLWSTAPAKAWCAPWRAAI
jgi:PAT family beta-lactamase induction signal transducer AmpG